MAVMVIKKDDGGRRDPREGCENFDKDCRGLVGLWLFLKVMPWFQVD